MPRRKRPKSFRVPNSIVQGLTTSTLADLNKLTAFEMVVLLGLVSRVSPKNPEAEVRITISEILDILQIGKQVAHAVERSWVVNGERRKKSYACSRHSPQHLQMIHAALVALHSARFALQKWDGAQFTRTDLSGHILDSFGYVYERRGKPLDLDDLPPGFECQNVAAKANDEHPLRRLRKRTTHGWQYDRASYVVFRLNTELAQELAGAKGTIKYTLLAHKVFGIFRQFIRRPYAIRLIILLLRQTNGLLHRRLGDALVGLGLDVTHPSRAYGELVELLGELRASGLVSEFSADQGTGSLDVIVNRQWYLGDD